MDEAQRRAVERFRELLRIPTVHPDAAHPSARPGDAAHERSEHDRPEHDWSEHERFLARLPELYPLLSASLERELIGTAGGGRSALYRWPGASGEAPLVLMAHYDVVPASDTGWTHPPFAAELEDDVIWARGAIDDKGELVAILEAVETLLAAGVTPPRDVYLSLGHDEESGGTGAREIVRTLRERGIRPGLVLDEGGAVVDDVFPGVDSPIAAIGVSEKGAAKVLLSVDQDGGHASTPPAMAATVRIARAVLRLERRPFPARLDPPVRAMLEAIGPHARGARGWAFRHLGLTAGLVTRMMARLGDETRAMVRTTMAVTRLSGSAADNVLAARATATVDVRIAGSASVAAVEEHVRRVVADPLVRVELGETHEPSPVSPTHGPAWDAVVAAVRTAFPDAVPVPYVMYAASDARHFAAISGHVYRFCAMRMTAAERAGLHGLDERIRVGSWLDTIAFYRALVRGYGRADDT
ncbi:MAG: M20/M25/M40 family metallo-hydrolase [Microbacteriaceae bacterium]